MTNDMILDRRRLPPGDGALAMVMPADRGNTAIPHDVPRWLVTSRGEGHTRPSSTSADLMPEGLAFNPADLQSSRRVISHEVVRSDASQVR